MVSIPGGEPLIHKELPQIVSGIVEREEVRVPLHERAAAREEDGRVHALALPDFLHPPRRQPRASRRVGVPRGRIRQRPSPPSRRRARSGFRVTINCTLFDGEDPDEVAPSSIRDGPRRRGHHRVAGIQLPARARVRTLPRAHEAEAVLPRHLRARQITARKTSSGASTTRACSSISSRATAGLPVHALEQSDPQRLRLAASLLSPRWTRAMRPTSRRSCGRPSGTRSASDATRSATTAWPIAATKGRR